MHLKGVWLECGGKATDISSHTSYHLFYRYSYGITIIDKFGLKQWFLLGIRNQMSFTVTYYWYAFGKR